MMKRSIVSAALLTVLAAGSLVAQAPGWKLRADRSTSAADPDADGAIKFTMIPAGAGTPAGFHVVAPQAAVFWKPENTVAGAYSVKGTFRLLKPSGHTNYYGIVFGGKALDAATQSYLYFVVGQDGTWLLKRRQGDVASNIVGKTPSPAVAKPDATGQSVNELEVRVAADKVDYLVNGMVVHTMPKSELADQTDGLYGIRINHQLEVRVDPLTVRQG